MVSKRSSPGTKPLRSRGKVMMLFPRLNLIPGRLGCTIESPRTSTAGLAIKIFEMSSKRARSDVESVSPIGSGVREYSTGVVTLGLLKAHVVGTILARSWGDMRLTGTGKATFPKLTTYCLLPSFLIGVPSSGSSTSNGACMRRIPNLSAFPCLIMVSLKGPLMSCSPPALSRHLAASRMSMSLL